LGPGLEGLGPGLQGLGPGLQGLGPGLQGLGAEARRRGHMGWGSRWGGVREPIWASDLTVTGRPFPFRAAPPRSLDGYLILSLDERTIVSIIFQCFMLRPILSRARGPPAENFF
jgi:hypothetical protein